MLFIFLFGFLVNLVGQSFDRVCILNPIGIDIMQLNQQHKKTLGRTELSEELDNLFHSANKALKDSVFSVTFKNQVPPSGDMHDYMSFAPYWWPDSTKVDGLPYIRKDGECNPEQNNVSDKRQLNMMAKKVLCLSVAYVVFGHSVFAEKADQLLRVWFLDSATRMNPNLNYGQAVQGRNVGKASGIIETRSFIGMLDAVELLRKDSIFEQHTYPGIKQWFNEYLTWLDTADLAIKERNARNNHGTWYTAQYARYAYFVGKDSLAKDALVNIKERIADQIDRDGKQALELIRTKSLSYSLFNIEAYFNCFSIADKVGLSLWYYETVDGRSVKKAFDFLMPYIQTENKWPYQQIFAIPYKDYYCLLKTANLKYANSNYEKYLALDIFKQYDKHFSTIIY